MQQPHHDDSNAPFWGNYGQPQYSLQQNGLQIIVNLPQNSFQQQPQHNVAGSIHFDQLPQETPGRINGDQPNQHHQEYAKPKPSITRLSKTPKIRKFISLLLILFTVANLFIIIALLIFHFGNKSVTLTSVGGALEYMGNNLSADPILEIRVQDDNGSCDTGYHAVLLRTWPETVAGCNCPTTGLKKGACNKSGKQPTDTLCTDIDPKSPVDMIDWGGSYWCVKRAQLGTQYTKSVNCKTGYRECSVGICVLSTLNCPVTRIDVQSSGTYKMRIGTNKCIVTTSILGAEPVVDLIITPNDIPCLSGESYAAGSTAPYKLINENEKGCSKYGLDNKNSFQVDNMTQGTLFGQNNFPSKVMNLPDYDNTYENTYSVLSYRQRTSVADNDFCLSIDTDLLEKSSDASKKLNKYMSGTSIGAIVIHGILAVAVVVFIGIMKSRGYSWEEILRGDGDSKAWSYFCTGLGFLEYIVLIVMLATVKHYRGVMKTTEEYLGKLDSMSCFLDWQPQAAVSDYQVAADVVAGTLEKYALTLFVITSLTVTPSLYMTWKAWRDSKNKWMRN